MTDYKGHLKIGIAIELFLLGVLLYYGKVPLDYTNVLFIILFLVINPLVMDLDHREGKLREWITTASFIFGLIGLFLNNNLIIKYSIIGGAIGFLLYFVTKHRSWVHSIPFALAYGFGISYLLGNNFYFMFCAFGCYTHLIGDNLFFKFK